MIELAMPAGSIQSALVAFRDGADAIYLGLQSYSARKGAVNFTIEEYSKIYSYAKSNNKKVYVTINTVIHDAQLKSVIRLLKEIEIVGSDGIIVQDLGISRIIKENFPSLELHGSTQLAVHSIKGVKAMKDLGFTRVVLSRELSIEEISEIRKACDDIELKVFVHGALCYGFSGLCMASNIITGRSANAGACAQICRTWFTYNNQNGYFFSMKDLEIAESVKKLRDINIDSLKVEGRMKSPSYVSAVTKYYRALLDDKPYEDLYENVKTTFARESSKGWLDIKDNNTSIIDSSYSSHKGIECATVIDVVSINNRDYALVDLERDIALHDGVMFINREREVAQGVKFSVSSLLDKTRKPIKRGRKYTSVYISINDRALNLYNGDKLYLIKKHDQDEKIINTDRLPFNKNYAKAKFIIEDNSISIVCNFDFINEVRIDRELKIEKAKRPFEYRDKINTIFSQSGDSFFEVESVEIENNSSIDFKEIFLPLSEIKELRRIFYEAIDDKEDLYIDEELSLQDKSNCFRTEDLPPRSKLVINDIPFFEDIPNKISELIKVEDKYYLPLPPVFFNEEELCGKLNKLIEEIISNNLLDKVYFGINNIAHLKWIENTNVKVYSDIYFYLANREAALNFLDTKLNIVGGYLFLETVVGDTSLWPFIPQRVDKDFVPPLFISRTNFSRDSLGKSKKDGKYLLNQRDNKYEVISRGELTFLIKRN